MQASEEVSDDILSYLMENGGESDSSFLDVDSLADNLRGDTDCDLELLDSTADGDKEQRIIEPISPSVKSCFSSRRLEWDSAADVGYINDENFPCFDKKKSRLSAIEKIALSSSASKLCFGKEDEDDHSRALMAKIDLLLGRSKRNIQLSAWSSIDSCTGSINTVIQSEGKPRVATKSLSASGEIENARLVGVQQPASSSDSKIKTDIVPTKFLDPVAQVEYYDLSRKNSVQETKSAETQTSLNYSDSARTRDSQSVPSKNKMTKYNKALQHSNVGSGSPRQASSRSKSNSSISEETARQRRITKDKDPISPFYGNPPNVPSPNCEPAPTAVDEDCRSDFVMYSRQLHHHRLQAKPKPCEELRVKLGLKEHLESLKHYVMQLEETWNFLNYSVPKSRTLSSAGYNLRHNLSRSLSLPSRTPSPNHHPHASINSSTLKSERSFEIERLNLNDTESEMTVKETVAPAKSKCCSHCSLRKKKIAKVTNVTPEMTTERHSSNRTDADPNRHRTSAVHNQGHYRESASHDQDRPRSSASAKLDPGTKVDLSARLAKAMKEPIAFDINLNADPRNLSLQESLKEKRPDFVLHSEQRRKAIQEMAYLRLVEKANFKSIPRLYTYQQMRKNTEKIYQKMPEAHAMCRLKDRQDAATSNRLRASTFSHVNILWTHSNLKFNGCILFFVSETADPSFGGTR